MITIGQYYTLEVVKRVDFGVYLDAENLGDVLLPKRYVPDDIGVGDSVDVFLHFDSEDRPIATTQRPKAKVGEFAYLQVTAVGAYGAFVDWGLDKEVLVPFGEQHRPMEVGKSYIVHLLLNHVDGRIIGSSKIEKYLDKEPHNFQPRQKVKLIIANTTEIGFKAIVDNSHWGVLFTDDVFTRLSFGQYKTGFIKRIRDDGKIDLTLQGGQETRDRDAHQIAQYLKLHNGFAAVHDKSEPERISQLFGMSKKAFKRAIGALYKEGAIDIAKDGIRLLEKD